MVVPPWHAAIAKLQELPTCPPINQIGVLPSVMVVQNQEGVFQMKEGFKTILPTLEDTIRFNL
jgi:hypothetical protein